MYEGKTFHIIYKYILCSILIESLDWFPLLNRLHCQCNRYVFLPGGLYGSDKRSAMKRDMTIAIVKKVTARNATAQELSRPQNFPLRDFEVRPGKVNFLLVGGECFSSPSTTTSLSATETPNSASSSSSSCLSFLKEIAIFLTCEPHLLLNAHTKRRGI